MDHKQLWMTQTKGKTRRLPPEVTVLLLSYISSLEDLKSLRLVDTAWRSAVHPVFSQRAVVLLNPENLKGILKNEDEDEEFKTKVQLKSFKLAFPPAEMSPISFGDYRRGVLAVFAGVGMEEVIVGDLWAPLKAQKLFLRQIFATCPGLKKVIINACIMEQIQIDNNQGELDGFLLLPPETKLKILEHLSLADLKVVTLVNHAWASCASTMMGKKGVLQLKSVSLNHILGDDEEGGNNGNFWFKSFKLKYTDPKKRGPPFLAYQEKVLRLLRTKVIGGGAGVEGLTICDLDAPKRLQTAFLNQVFNLCPIVKTVCIDRKELSICESEDLPTLEQCQTVKLVGKGSYLSPSFVNATPNVDELVLVKGVVKLPTNAWPQLARIVGDKERPPTIDRYIFFLDNTFTFPRLREISSLVVKDVYRRPFELGFGYLMNRYAESLEILDLDFRGCRLFEVYPNYTRPVMRKLHTLSLVDTRTGLRVGCFGVVSCSGRMDGMQLDIHFPILHTLRYVTNQVAGDAFLLNFHPLSQRRQIFPQITTLELDWPDPETQFNLWRDWTRRAATMFPNVQNNEHIDKWRALQLETPDVVGEGPDEVDLEFQRYEDHWLL